MGLIRGDFRGGARGIFRAMPEDFTVLFVKSIASMGRIFGEMVGLFG